MPRFYFDFRQGSERIPDAQGLELADSEQAYLEVFKAVQDMWSELLKNRRDPRRCAFEVRSEEGDILFHFPFQEVVDCCTDRVKAPMHRTFQDLASTHNYARRVRDEFVQEMRSTQQVLQESRTLLRQVQEQKQLAP